MTLVTTPGAADATSYASLAEALTRAALDVRGGTFAALSSDEEQEPFLAMATAGIDAAITGTERVAGSPYSADQALLYPRDTATLPKPLVLATILHAFHLAERSALGEIGTPIRSVAGIKKKVVDVLSTEFFSDADVDRSPWAALPADVRGLLSGLLLSSTTSWGSATAVRTG